MTKQEMVARMRRGEFGNTLRAWWTWDSICAELDTLMRQYMVGHTPETPVFRLRTKVPNGKMILDVNPAELKPEMLETHYLSEAAPDALTLVQGEFFDQQWPATSIGPYFRHCFDKTQMVAAMKSPNVRCAHGADALTLIHAYMDEYSWDNFQNLREEFPNYVIEFSVFGRGLGALGWNTVFWELRERY